LVLQSFVGLLKSWRQKNLYADYL